MINFDTLKNAHFFKNISSVNFDAILACLGAEYREYEKGRTIVFEGDIVSSIGILVSGTVRSVKTGLDGRQTIIAFLKPGNYIGILLAGSHDRHSPVSVKANEDVTVLFIPINNILSRGDCPQHAVLLGNLIDGIAEKALMLHDRNDCLIKPTVRSKILTYLNKVDEPGRVFTIPFNREEMAEYLNVDRSALSRELSIMKRDGLIDFHKNSFKLIESGGFDSI